jgi:MFS family permease
MIRAGNIDNAASEPALTSTVSIQEDRPWSRVKRRYLLSLLCLTAFANLLDRQIFALLLEPIKRDLHLSDTQLGFVTGGAFAVVYMIAGIPLGRGVDTGKRRTILGATVLVWSTMTMFCGFARHYSQLLIARMGVGIGEAGSMPATMSVIGDIYPANKRSGAIGLIYAFTMIGTAASLLLGGYLESTIGWRRTFFVVGTPGIVLGLLFFLTTSEPVRTQTSVNKGTLFTAMRATWQVPSFRILVCMSTLFTFSGSAIIGWGPTFLIRVHHIPTAKVGATLGTAMICGAAGSFMWGKLADHLAKSNINSLLVIMALGPLLAIPAMLAFLYGSGAPMLIGSYILLQVFLTAYLAPGYALAIGVTPSQSRALTIAIIAVFQNLGGLALGPLVVGILNDAWAPRFGALAIRYSLTVASVGLIGVAILAVFASRHVKRDFARTEDPPGDPIR